MGMVHAGLANHGSAWLALEQTAGKGQWGKKWNAMGGMNITMSVAVQPEPISSDQSFSLSAAVALACFDLFAGYAGEETRIKWPNDLYWRDRKAGGILIENVYHGKNWKWAIIGTGININQTVFDPSLSNPVSLKQITGNKFDVIGMAGRLHMGILQHISLLQEEAGSGLIERYNDLLYKKGEEVTLIYKGEHIRTTIRSVTKEGSLVTSDHSERRFSFGEVEWVL